MATLSVSSLWSFRDTEEVLVSAELREGRLVVQVEENLTAEQWRGQFDKKRRALAYVDTVSSQACQAAVMETWFSTLQTGYIHSDIEELTRKTGNFKSFSVFLKMLESAITKVKHATQYNLMYSCSLCLALVK